MGTGSGHAAGSWMPQKPRNLLQFRVICPTTRQPYPLPLPLPIPVLLVSLQGMANHVEPNGWLSAAFPSVRN